MAVIIINPPPEDCRCEVCGRHVSKLRPFTKSDFAFPENNPYIGALLIRNYRPMVPRLTDEQLKSYREKYGDRNVDFYEQAMNTVEASWECRDCFKLSDEDAYKKRMRRCRK